MDRLSNLFRNLLSHIAKIFSHWRAGEPRRGPKSIDPFREVHDRCTSMCPAPTRVPRLLLGLLLQLVSNILHFFEFKVQHVVVLFLSVAVIANRPMNTLSTNRLGLDMPPREAPVLTSEALLSMLLAVSNHAATAKTSRGSIGKPPNVNLATLVPALEIHQINGFNRPSGPGDAFSSKGGIQQVPILFGSRSFIFLLMELL
jgi:hypothetical protein